MIWIGTSGYSYPEWKGSFYPAKLPAKKMFAFYAEQFSTVEINNTFYRLPDEELIRNWANTSPEGFRFALKAPKRITHEARLRNCEDLLRVFIERARLLGDKLGPLLFQLPPFARKDAELLKSFAAWIPTGTRAAFEFRHASWFDEEIYDVLREKNIALCIADSERLSTPPVATSDYGYLRLRDEGYGEADLQRWSDVVLGKSKSATQWQDTFVYFKHEEEGKGPEFAHAMKKMIQPEG